MDLNLLAVEEEKRDAPLNGSMSPSSLIDQSPSNCFFDLSKSRLSNLRDSDIPWMVIDPE